MEVIKRPAFRLNTTVSPKGLARPMLPPPKRVIEQGKRVKPRGFRTEPPRGRIAVGAAEAEARRIKSEGIKVALGESTLSKLLDIKVPLKRADGSIILDSAGKPVTKTIRVNLGNLSKTFTEKIDLVQRAIASGEAATRNGLIQLTAMLLSVKVDELKVPEQEQFATSVASLGYDPVE